MGVKATIELQDNGLIHLEANTDNPDVLMALFFQMWQEAFMKKVARHLQTPAVVEAQAMDIIRERVNRLSNGG